MACEPPIVVFTGAGVSADSGLSTFRDSDGLWARYRIEDVCTPEALAVNRPTVIEFYNMRRKELLSAKPNAGHHTLAELERDYPVRIVTQNIDDLHERAGSTDVLHLHGHLRKLRSSRDENLIVPIDGWEQDPTATAPDGSLLRPHVVFFGEAVPMFEPACEDCGRCRIIYRGGHVPGGLSRRVTGPVRATGSARICDRPGQPRYITDSQPGNRDPQKLPGGYGRGR